MTKKINGHIKLNNEKKPKKISELKIITIVGKVGFYDYTSLLKIKCKVCGKTEPYGSWEITEELTNGIGVVIPKVVCPTCKQQYVK